MQDALALEHIQPLLGAMKAGTLCDRIRIDTPVDAIESVGAAKKDWALVAEVNAVIRARVAKALRRTSGGASTSVSKSDF